MFSLNILEVVIGLSFIYMIFSLMTTSLTEFVAQILSMRSDNLRRGIRVLLNDWKETGLAGEFYDHPLVKSLSREGRVLWLAGGKNKPSYINPRTFVQTLLDIVINENPSQKFKSVKDLEQIVKAIQESSILSKNPDVKEQLEIILDGANSVEEAYKSIENWFNDMMDRIGGWYKRKAHLVTLIISILVAVGFNVDSVALFNRLSNDPAVRTALVGAAQSAIQKELEATPSPESTPEPGAVPDLASTYAKVTELQQQVNTSFQIVGWQFPPNAPIEPRLSGLSPEASQKAEETYKAELALYEAAVAAYPNNPLHIPQTTSEWISKIIGLGLTAIAISLGAPFWFDVLKRITSIRGAGNNPVEETIVEKKEKVVKTDDKVVASEETTSKSEEKTTVRNISSPLDDGGVG